MLTLKQVGAIRVWDFRSIRRGDSNYKKNRTGRPAEGQTPAASMAWAR